MFQRMGRAAVLGAALTMIVGAGAAFAHESRDVGDHTVRGRLHRRAGLHRTEERPRVRRLPRRGAARGPRGDALRHRVTFGDQTRDLEIEPRFGEPGWYQSVFFPTAAGPYTFRIFGEIEGEPFDESFTSGPDTFSEVQDVTGGQFPVQFPSTGDIVRDAEAGASAATTSTIALVLGGAGLVAGLVALGLTLAAPTPVT